MIGPRSLSPQRAAARQPLPSGQPIGTAIAQSSGESAGRETPAATRADHATRASSACRIDALITQHGRDPTALIEVLHRVQLDEGHLSSASLHRVAIGLRLPLSHVIGVATFYHLFRRTPPPAHRCAVCLGTACFVNGAPRLLRELRQRMAEDDAAAAGGSAGLPGSAAAGWRLQRSGCLAACGHGAVLQVDGGPIVRIRPEEPLLQRLDGLGLPPRLSGAPAEPGPAAAGAARRP